MRRPNLRRRWLFVLASMGAVVFGALFILHPLVNEPDGFGEAILFATAIVCVFVAWALAQEE